MRQLRFVGTAFCLLVGMVVLQGCAILIPIGIGVAGTAGTVSYVGNELHVVQPVSLDRAWDAANATAKDMGFTILSQGTRRDATYGILRAQNAKRQEVVIQVSREQQNLTQIKIRVGFWSTKKNGIEADAIYEKMASKM
jgi:hypothetical protein